MQIRTKRKISRDPALILTVLLALLFVSNFFIASPVHYPRESGQITVTIPKGASLDQIADILAHDKIIRSKLLFKLSAELKGSADSLQAGVYVLKKGESAADLLRKMHNGETVSIKFTVPEGYNVKQVAALLQEKGVVSADAFLAAVKTYRPEGLKLPDTEYPFEGYLFPDTYQVEPGTAPDAIIRMMVHRFFQVVKQDDIAKLNQKGLTLNQAVTLASIVEREAKVDSERPVIAGVFLKRLSIGMPLQSCATIQYLLPKQKEKLTYKDLGIQSPYNTYLHKGLPPGPISNPGKASLLAVIDAKDEGYLYFVSKNDGTHVFSRTLAEHDAAKEKYQE